MKKIMSAVLASAMSLSLAITPFAAYTTTSVPDVVTDNDVKNPIYNFSVPITNEFAVDAFQKQATAGQIYAGNFAVINKSDVPLRVAITPKLGPGTAVNSSDKIAAANVKGSPAEVPNSAANTDKDLYVELTPANTADITTENGTAVSPGAPMPVLANETPIETTLDNTASTGNLVEGDGTESEKPSIKLGAFTAEANKLAVDNAVDLVITNDADPAVEFGRTMSAAVTDAAKNTAADLAALFAGKTIELPVNYTKPSGDRLSFTISGGTGGILTLTSSTAGMLASYNGAKLKASIVPSKGIAATAEITPDTTPEYAEYNDATGSATTGKVVATGDDKAESLVFALDRGTYVQNYNNEADPTLCSELSTTTCAGVYTIRGTVNPSADWKEKSALLTLKYTVNGISTSAYAAKRDATSGEMNLLNNSKEPSWQTLPSGAMNLSGNTALSYKLNNGTKDSLLVVSGETVSPFTVTVTNDVNTEPADVTAGFGLAMVSGNLSLTVDKEALIATGYVINGNNKFTVSFTGTDDYVTTLSTGTMNVSGIA